MWPACDVREAGAEGWCLPRPTEAGAAVAGCGSLVVFQQLLIIIFGEMAFHAAF